MDDLAQWLEQLGLARYARLFAENDIDLDALPHLTDDELKELGVTLGHRAKLRAALKARADTHPSAEPGSPRAHETKPQPADAERRQVTVMFCDLVSSTALSTELEAEDYRDVIRAYQNACASVVARFDGFLAKLMGDGLLIYFGWPRAHEDDAERAISAGLGILKAVQSMTAIKGRPPAVRIGIATGRVVVGDIVGEGASQEAAIVGEAPNLAARLQAIAEPNTIVIADATHALAGDLFECTSLGAQALKGFDAPLTVWRVDAPRPIESRFEATRMRSLTPFIGREEEIDILKRRWQRACRSEGQVVLLSGEAGIGKSRIVSAFRDRVGAQSHTWLRYQCSPYYTNSALYPVVEQLARAARFESNDDPARKLAKLEALLALSRRPMAGVVPLIAALLSIPLGDGYAPVTVSPQLQKQLTLAALVDQLAGLAERRPVLFHFEDAHWIDPTSRELLDLLIARTSGLAALVLISFRPQFSPPWTGEPHVTLVSLSRLEARTCAHLTTHVAGAAVLTPGVVAEIVMRADGVPLFVEEITKAVLETIATEAGLVDARSRLAIPASIEASLMARLDHLGPVKEVAQIAAVIGRTFARELLAAVVDRDEASLETALDRLVSAGLIYQRTATGGVGYEFKHTLVRDAAYQSLLRGRRQQLHARIAGVLEQQAAETVQPELLAYHLTEAGVTEQAVDYWLKAGQRAMLRSAHIEAENHLRRGLELLAPLPQTASRLRREIALQNALGVCLMPTRGFGNPEVAAAFARGAELAERGDDARGLFVSLRGRGQYHFGSGDLRTGRDDTQRVMALAERMGDQDCLIEAHHLCWSVFCHTGEFAAAQRHVEEGIARYQRERDHHLTYTYSGHDPGTCSRGYGALILSQLGYAARAQAMANDALALAEALAHPFSMAIALVVVGFLNVTWRQTDAVRTLGERLIAYAGEMGLRPMVSFGKFIKGEALTHQGEIVEGIAQMRESLAELRAVRYLITMPPMIASLADAVQRSGKTDEGLAAVEEGLEMVDAGGERFVLPEIHRVKGRLLLDRSAADRDAAAAAYRQAIAIARDQEARLLELRAATSLARLWGENGKRDAARELLAPTYQWFTEGFDKPDLRDAKALLDELA
jgi:class 3 adenylate cyclase/predicted ATPase/predicted transcriptional regulator